MPLCDRGRLGGREDARLRERELGRDRQHRRSADRLPQRAGGLDGAVGLGGEHDEVGGAGRVLVRGPLHSELGGSRPGALRVPRSDHNRVARLA